MQVTLENLFAKQMAKADNYLAKQIHQEK